MFPGVDQLSNATKSTFNSQINSMNEVASRTFNNFTELMSLNLSASKASVEQLSKFTQEIMSAKDSKHLMDIATSQTKPGAENLLKFNKKFVEIASKSQQDFANLAEIKMEELTTDLNKTIDDLSKSAPAGSENAIAMIKASVANLNVSFEQFLKASQHANNLIDDSIDYIEKHFETQEKKPSKSKKSS